MTNDEKMLLNKLIEDSKALSKARTEYVELISSSKKYNENSSLAEKVAAAKMEAIQYEAISTLFEELLYYKNAADQELLLMLPCKIGTKVWKIKECSGGGRIPNWYEIYAVEFSLNLVDEFEKTVFLTKEEADAALEKLKNER